MSLPENTDAPPAWSTGEAKALLLLRRERELYDLRQLRWRTEEWLQALHALRPEGEALTVSDLACAVTNLLVGDLNFEVAGAFEYDPVPGTLKFAHLDPLPSPNGLTFDPDAVRFFESKKSGSYQQGELPVMRTLAEQLGLERFYWAWFASDEGSRFLLLAGSTARTSRLLTITESESIHFSMFATHAASLLNNSLLVAHIERERTELSTANQELDRSLTKLSETQRQLIESTQMVAHASRQAGMAEVATGVLHNVGNVLNSVRISGDVAANRAEKLRIAGLFKLVELLEQQSDLAEFFGSDERAEQVVRYLRQSSEALDTERGEILQELRQLQEHISHVAAIISRQQAYAKTGSVEMCNVASLMEDALLIAREASSKGHIEIVRDYSVLDEIEVDRHRALQILVNLTSNALRAVEESNKPHKRVIARIGPGPGDRVLMSIEDNGVGIRPEHESKLFGYGFTTRRDGHGFGLHNASMTAKELGGTLRFENLGCGHGARFILELPPTAMTSMRAGAGNKEPVNEQCI